MTHYCVRCGTELQTRIIEGHELEACPNDDFVLWRDPKVAAAVVVEVDGGVVLGRRAIEPGYGMWCLPGGFVNDDEHPAEAAIRECMEEISAAVELTSLLGVYHVPKRDAPSIVGIAYRGRLADGETLKAGSEMLDVQVFPVGSLPPLAFPSHRYVIEQYLKSLASAEATAHRPAAGSQPGTRPSPARGQPTPPHKP